MLRFLSFLASMMLVVVPALASEADLSIPDLKTSYYSSIGLNGWQLLVGGFFIIFLGFLFGIRQFMKTKHLPVHESMAAVSDTIYETCKTYLLQQGKFLIALFVIIGTVIFYYFFGLNGLSLTKSLIIMAWTVVGILGSYGVAWFGIRINTYANSRTAFASLKGEPYPVMSIPLASGMSVGTLLICVELVMMLVILLFMPADTAGACFLGFAIGESLGASALRIAGGIFTKIADIGSDLMKVFFNMKEDDPQNPGVIADCTGDNAGDSVGPTADGFETYGVTGVALISFIVLMFGATGVLPNVKLASDLIVWIFVMRLLMIITSILSYYLSQGVAFLRYGEMKDSFNFETPLTALIWTTSIISIGVTYVVSYWLLLSWGDQLWWRLATIISCGTLAAAIIPEFTKAFTSTRSRHVDEIVTASGKGGASLTILSGIVAGYYSAFWKGLVILGLMLLAYATISGVLLFGDYAAVFAFGLVAFGFLGMGPVTIAVDSYGPVTDNAQSIYELSQIETIANIENKIQTRFGYRPQFNRAKDFLEENDGAGNTFKATSKPVLIGTAVVGAMTMIFAIILTLDKVGALNINLINPWVIFGFGLGGAVIFWFSGAAVQAVTTGAYHATEFIRDKLAGGQKMSVATIADSKKVVAICTAFAQRGMLNIFIAVFCFALSFAFIDPNMFIAYLFSIAFFGLYQAMFMANAGGAWDNAKKVVETALKAKNTELHKATVVGDTVGDPFKDTSGVAFNPIIKFTTLFGLLAVEIAIKAQAAGYAFMPYLGVMFFFIAAFFAYRSFYGMRIRSETSDAVSVAITEPAID